jgi:hypothetical protein
VPLPIPVAGELAHDGAAPQSTIVHAGQFVSQVPSEQVSELGVPVYPVSHEKSRVDPLAVPVSEVEAFGHDVGPVQLLGKHVGQKPAQEPAEQVKSVELGLPAYPELHVNVRVLPSATLLPDIVAFAHGQEGGSTVQLPGRRVHVGQTPPQVPSAKQL